ncbi:cysteine desulfurase [bacterium]|nr:cysteine desulfurase [bacterium]
MGIYLDHAATTPVKPAVAEEMRRYLTDRELMANPFSNHAPGRRAAEARELLRLSVANHFMCLPDDVIFNSGGSEGDTHALAGAALLLDKPVHLAISAIEHEAVVETAKRLGRLGNRISIVPVSADGVVEVDYVEDLLKGDKPDLVSVMTVNNEVGTVQPIGEIAALCRQYDVLFHTDAVRAVGHGLEHLVTDPNIHLINCTAHKFGGPRGVGVLIQRGVRLPQLIRGGGQEGGARAGTENLAGFAGFVKALELAAPEEAQAIEQLRAHLEYELITRLPNCEIHAKRAERATHITSVSFKPRSGYKLQEALDEIGIAVGTGSACHDDGDVTISPVLTAMGVEEFLARGTLRLSLGWPTTKAEIDEFLERFIDLLDKSDDSLNCPI